MTETQNDTFFFGIHFMLDGYDAPAALLENQKALTEALVTIPKTMDMYTISDPVVVEVGPNNKKDPGGISGVVLIAESHLSFHTFPKRGFVTIDLYSCKDNLDTEKLFEELKRVFQFKRSETYKIERGRNYPKNDIH